MQPTRDDILKADNAQLDAWAAERVMGWRREPVCTDVERYNALVYGWVLRNGGPDDGAFCQWASDYMNAKAWSPSNVADDALLMLEHLRKTAHVNIQNCCHDEQWCVIICGHKDEDALTEYTCEKLPRAATIAALFYAMGVEN